MPWKVVKGGGSCPDSKPYAVVNTEDGERRGCHETRGGAVSQLRALYVNVPEGRPKAVAEWAALMDHVIELAEVQ
jgi:hypothetical protein